ncbi:MAG: HAD hydrolase family protein [Actinomycetota bacterium]|nr:HAD hydrolase family protein [Actinomycetota bacterium]
MNPAVPYLDEHPLAASALSRSRLLYTDLDGTLLGLGGSLLVDADRQPSLVAAEAIVAVNRAGLEIVICSGRNRIQIAEIARLCGWRGFIAELGCVIVPDRGAEPVYRIGSWDASALASGETPFEAIERVGALTALRETFPGRIENHAPYHLNREATHVLRGSIDIGRARDVLAGLDLPIDIVDNGIIHPLTTGLTDVEEVHAYHLMPAGVTKAAALHEDLERRAVAPDTALAIGDSATDVEMADATALGVIVANALDDDRVVEAASSRPNVAATRSQRGEGWAEFASAWLSAVGADA